MNLFIFQAAKFICSVLLVIIVSLATAACTSSHSDPSSSDQQAQASEMNADAAEAFRLVNLERTKAGLTPLQINKTCVQMAQAHSEDMLARGFFSHDSPTETFQQRVHRWGLDNGYAGENIAMYPSASTAVQGWMNSPGHKANILNPNFSSSGMGFSGSFYTQCFYGN